MQGIGMDEIKALPEILQFSGQNSPNVHKQIILSKENIAVIQLYGLQKYMVLFRLHFRRKGNFCGLFP